MRGGKGLSKAKQTADHLEELFRKSNRYIYSRVAKNQTINYTGSNLPFEKFITNESRECFLIERKEFKDLKFEVLIVDKVLQSPKIWVYMRGHDHAFVRSPNDVIQWIEDHCQLDFEMDDDSLIHFAQTHSSDPVKQLEFIHEQKSNHQHALKALLVLTEEHLSHQDWSKSLTFTVREVELALIGVKNAIDHMKQDLPDEVYKYIYDKINYILIKSLKSINTESVKRIEQ